IEELTLADIAAAFADGRLTSRRLTQAYLDRIDSLDRRGPTLRAVLETNPQALDSADQLDRERRAHGPRGPLHGVPVLIVTRATDFPSYSWATACPGSARSAARWDRTARKSCPRRHARHGRNSTPRTGESSWRARRPRTRRKPTDPQSAPGP